MTAEPVLSRLSAGDPKPALRQRAIELGFDLCRFTSALPPASGHHFAQWLAAGCHGRMTYLARSQTRRLDPQQVLPGARSLVVVASSYAPPAEARLVPGGSMNTERLTGLVARYARAADYHTVLVPRLAALAEYATALGGPGTRSSWSVDTGPLLERDLAQRAGLGFVGKHTNLISRRFGNWLFLAEVLTTLEVEPDLPESNHCGVCARCLAACPTGALTAPYRLDARRCLSYLTIELKGPIPLEFRPKLGRRIFGCDDCLAVCPWNRFARQGRLMRNRFRPDLEAPALLELLALDETGFRARFGGTPIERAQRRGLLRNVCVALGNAGDPGAIPALEQAARDPEPLIAEHAHWAAARLRTPH